MDKPIYISGPGVCAIRLPDGREFECSYAGRWYIPGTGGKGKRLQFASESLKNRLDKIQQRELRITTRQI